MCVFIFNVASIVFTLYVFGACFYSFFGSWFSSIRLRTEGKRVHLVFRTFGIEYKISRHNYNWFDIKNGREFPFFVQCVIQECYTTFNNKREYNERNH